MDCQLSTEDCQLFSGFRHLASLVRFFPTERTGAAEFVGDHRIVRGTGAAELSFFDDITDVEHHEDEAHEADNGEK